MCIFVYLFIYFRGSQPWFCTRKFWGSNSPTWTHLRPIFYLLFYFSGLYFKTCLYLSSFICPWSYNWYSCLKSLCIFHLNFPLNVFLEFQIRYLYYPLLLVYCLCFPSEFLNTYNIEILRDLSDHFSLCVMFIPIARIIFSFQNVFFLAFIMPCNA